MKMINCSLYYRTMAKSNPNHRVVCFDVLVPEGAHTVEAIIGIGSKERCMALAGRADKGVFEIQTDLGIFSRPADIHLVRRDGTAYGDVVFKTWAQMEQEEAE